MLHCAEGRHSLSKGRQRRGQTASRPGDGQHLRLQPRKHKVAGPLACAAKLPPGDEQTKRYGFFLNALGIQAEKSPTVFLGLRVSCIKLNAIDRPTRLAKHLTDHDLRQLDPDALSRLGEGAMRRLVERLLADLKEASDRLNQDSRNSSRPPGSDSVYRQPRAGSGADPPTEPASGQTSDEASPAVADAAEKTVDPSDAGGSVAKKPSRGAAPAASAARRPGRQPGAPGVGRTQKLAVNAVRDPWPEQCAACGEHFADEPMGPACDGTDEIEWLPPIRMPRACGSG